MFCSEVIWCIWEGKRFCKVGLVFLLDKVVSGSVCVNLKMLFFCDFVLFIVGNLIVCVLLWKIVLEGNLKRDELWLYILEGVDVF